MSNANAPSVSFATYAPFAKGAYGSYNQAEGQAINGWTPVQVHRFTAENPYFAAQLYTDGQGHYRVAMRGSNEGGDFLGADAALAVGRWNSQLTDAINFVGEAMLQVKSENRDIAFDKLRESFDCTGHSLGGSLCETAGKFYGLRGMNIDGPGVAAPVRSSEFAQLKDDLRNRGLDELRDNYTLAPGDFQARQYTLIGTAGAHIADADVYTVPDLDAQLKLLEQTPPWAYAFDLGGVSLNRVGASLSTLPGHFMDKIFAVEGLPPPSSAGDIETVRLDGQDYLLNHKMPGEAVDTWVFREGNTFTKLGVAHDGGAVVQVYDGSGQPIRVVAVTDNGIEVATPDAQGNWTIGETIANPEGGLFLGALPDIQALKRLVPALDQIDATLNRGPHADPATSAQPTPPPALDENGMPLPEIGKTSGLTDEQWNALAAGLSDQPSTLDTSKATRLAANAHADTVIDGDVTSGEEPGESTPKADEAAPATPDPALAAVGNMQSLILAIEHGNDLAATIAAVGLVNNLGQAAGVGNIIPGEIGATLGTIASALNLADALDRGDVGGIVVSGVTLADTVSQGAASKAIAEALGMSAAVDVIPYLGIINGLANGDAVSTLAAAANLIPGYGQVISIAIVFLGAMFGGDDEPDTPTSYGDASAGWNDAGDIKIATTRDEADGGATAQAWMNNLLGGLQEELASRTDASGQPLYGLDPARLPGIGYAFDPDTQAGYLRLSWTEPDGTLQWRQYDTSGRRDGSGEAGTNDLVRDFFLHAADAIVPAWEARTLFQQGADGGRRTAFTGELSADGATTTRTVLTLGSAATSTNARLDIDGDGYLEATQWTASPMLAIDLDGDGRITAADLVDGREGSQARNGLAALDADGDGIVDARDPAFAALRLWRDANGDGIAEAGELGSLAEAGVERIDASTLARQTLAGDTRGTAQAMTADGLYQFQEGGETTLLALNQHAFDNDPAHAHGGEANPDAHGEMLVDVGAANESRLQSTGNLGPANHTIRPSAYTHRHIARRRAHSYNSTLSAKTRDQAGGGQPMTVQRTARARSFQGAMN